MDGEELAKLYGETKTAADALHAKAAEILEMAKQLEHLTKDTPAWYATTRAKVEARAALEQAQELRRVLEDLGERLGK
jgi:predicted YcjX-like family ATPase